MEQDPISLHPKLDKQPLQQETQFTWTDKKTVHVLEPDVKPGRSLLTAWLLP